MAMPWGRWAIGIVGLGVVAGGLYQIYLGFKDDFDKQFQIYTLSSKDTKTGFGHRSVWHLGAGSCLCSWWADW